MRRRGLGWLAHRKYVKKWILLNTKANKANNRKISKGSSERIVTSIKKNIIVRTKMQILLNKKTNHKIICRKPNEWNSNIKCNTHTITWFCKTELKTNILMTSVNVNILNSSLIFKSKIHFYPKYKIHR